MSVLEQARHAAVVQRLKPDGKLPADVIPAANLGPEPEFNKGLSVGNRLSGAGA